MHVCLFVYSCMFVGSLACLCLCMLVVSCVQNGSTCLLQACENGHLDVVKFVYAEADKKLLTKARQVGLIFLADTCWCAGGTGCVSSFLSSYVWRCVVCFECCLMLFVIDLCLFVLCDRLMGICVCLLLSWACALVCAEVLSCTCVRALRCVRALEFVCSCLTEYLFAFDYFGVFQVWISLFASLWLVLVFSWTILFPCMYS